MKLLLITVALFAMANARSLGERNDKEELHKELLAQPFREGCFPLPDGCWCKEAVEGVQKVVKYNGEFEFKCYVDAEEEEEEGERVKRAISRKQAKANYDKVVQELNDRFRGYLENCFPKPKGCTCVTGKDKNGREKTERRMNDKDCKKKATSKKRGRGPAN